MTQLLYIYSAVFHRHQHGKYAAAWRELVLAKQTLASISAQDEFARWARQQRTVDRLQGDFDKLHGQRQQELLTRSLGLSLFLRAGLYIYMFWLLSWKFLGARIACFGSELFGPMGYILSIPRCPQGKFNRLALYSRSL